MDWCFQTLLRYLHILWNPDSDNHQTRNRLHKKKLFIQNQHYVENEVENHTNEWTKEQNELETDFTRDSKSCQPPCTEKLPTLRPKKLEDDLIEYYLQYQSDDIRNLIKQFASRYTDLEDEDLVTLIDMTIDSRDVYSQHKFDIGQTT